MGSSAKDVETRLSKLLLAATILSGLQESGSCKKNSKSTIRDLVRELSLSGADEECLQHTICQNYECLRCSLYLIDKIALNL